MLRPNGRRLDELRPISIIRHYTKHAEGSVLIRFGDTQVLCNASVEERVPPFLRNQKLGWVTAEYSMLPRATNTRGNREVVRGRQSGRSMEIQRLIGRSLRASLDMRLLGERTIVLDCDVIQADGSTRSAAICGAYVALADAVNWLLYHELIDENPLQRSVGAVSVGVFAQQVITDLDYAEDNRADIDLNVVMDSQANFIEIQGTAEAAGKTAATQATPFEFNRDRLNQMLDQAHLGIEQILRTQQEALHDGSA